MNNKSAYQSSILILLVYIITSFTSLSASNRDNSKSLFSDDELKWKVINLGANINFKYTPEVKGYIKRYTKHKSGSEFILGYTPVYFPIFEKIIKEKNLPEELKVLAIVESHLKVNAYSKAGAAGLWQFIKGTARQYNLTVSSNFDQRYDVEESTRAALSFLNDLYIEFNDWTLALAAYNCGAGNVRKAIRRSGGYTDFWKIKKYLPKETRNYIPKFIAISYMLKHYKEHDLYPAAPDRLYFSTSEALIYKHMSFKKISDITGVPMSIIKNMNSSYRKNYIPVNTHGYKLTLPKNALYTLLEFEGYKKIEFVKDNNINYSKYILSKFSREVAMHLLGNEYSLKINKLSTIKFEHLFAKSRAGLISFTPIAKIDRRRFKINEENIIYHKLKAGESLMDVAMLYENVNIVDLLRWNNIGLKHPPKTGTQIKIQSL